MLQYLSSSQKSHQRFIFLFSSYYFVSFLSLSLHLTHYNSLIVFLEIFSSIVVNSKNINKKNHHCAMKKNTQATICIIIYSILLYSKIRKSCQKKYEERFKVCIHKRQSSSSLASFFVLNNLLLIRNILLFTFFFHLSFWLIMKRRKKMCQMRQSRASKVREEKIKLASSNRYNAY